MLFWFIEIYLDFNNYIIQYMVSLRSKSTNIGTWPLEQNFCMFQVMSCLVKGRGWMLIKRRWITWKMKRELDNYEQLTFNTQHNSSKKWDSLVNQHHLLRYSWRPLRACVSLYYSSCIWSIVSLLFCDIVFSLFVNKRFV